MLNSENPSGNKKPGKHMPRQSITSLFPLHSIRPFMGGGGLSHKESATHSGAVGGFQSPSTVHLNTVVVGGWKVIPGGQDIRHSVNSGEWEQSEYKDPVDIRLKSHRDTGY